MSSPSSVRKYPLLRFQPQVDWQHVNPELLQKLNALAAQTHHVITIFSGYRSNKYSAQVGGFAGDPHTRHIAVDANIDGKPIGSIISPAQFAAVGLITGNQPNFYNGKPDPSHVQLGGEAGSSPAAPSGASSNAPVAGQDTTAAAPQSPALPTPGQAQPSDTQADVFGTTPYEPPPGSGMNSTNPFVASLWNRIAAQPGASADTQLLASNAQLIGG